MTVKELKLCGLCFKEMQFIGWLCDEEYWVCDCEDKKE
tara:strand:+ start:2527 stop:2640 length:114 start_codon:yes stop_codon:yes gene_type:complete